MSTLTEKLTEKLCPCCQRSFVPDKYHPGQQYCSTLECKRLRQQRYKQSYNREWRHNNPDYFQQYWRDYRGL